MNRIEAFITDFAQRTGNDAQPVGTICFGMNEVETARAIEMIRCGRRTAMLYPACGYRSAMHPNPQTGDLNIVTDWNGSPACMIETIRVDHACAGEVTDALCAAACEYDTAAAWRDGAVKTEVEELGQAFDPDTPVIIETFRLA